AKNLDQWYFRITDYADRLLDDMALLEDWPERVLTMQRNWIGRSHGAEIDFRQPDLDEVLRVFTTRPDTVFGATFFVLAPEHPLVGRLAGGLPAEQDVVEYVKRTAATRGEERLVADREKTGVFTGRYALNPATGQPVPIWGAGHV